MRSLLGSKSHPLNHAWVHRMDSEKKKSHRILTSIGASLQGFDNRWSKPLCSLEITYKEGKKGLEKKGKSGETELQ